MRALILLLIASPAYAEPLCGDRAGISAFLETEYGEALAFSGVTGGGEAVEMFANTRTGTWTLLVNVPGWPSCLVDAGGAFEAIMRPGEPT